MRKYFNISHVQPSKGTDLSSSAALAFYGYNFLKKLIGTVYYCLFISLLSLPLDLFGLNDTIDQYANKRVIVNLLYPGLNDSAFSADFKYWANNLGFEEDTAFENKWFLKATKTPHTHSYKAEQTIILSRKDKEKFTGEQLLVIRNSRFTNRMGYLSNVCVQLNATTFSYSQVIVNDQINKEKTIKLLQQKGISYRQIIDNITGDGGFTICMGDDTGAELVETCYKLREAGIECRPDYAVFPFTN
jgi:hypothetical protein